MLITVLFLQLMLTALGVITALLPVLHWWYFMYKDWQVCNKEPSSNVVVAWLRKFCPVVATNEKSRARQVPKENSSAKKISGKKSKCHASSSSRKQTMKETCITGVENSSSNGLNQQLKETGSVVVVTSCYIPSALKKATVSRGGGDSGLQTQGSTATGNGDGSESDNSDANSPHSSGEDEHLPAPTECQGNGKVESDDDHDSSPTEVLVDQSTPPCDNATECPERIKKLAQPREVNKQDYGPEVVASFQSSNQVNPADIAAESKVKTESVAERKIGHVNSEKKVTVDGRKAERMKEGGMGAEDNGEIAGADKGRTEADDNGIAEAEVKGSGEAEDKRETEAEDSGKAVAEVKGNGEAEEEETEAASKEKIEDVGKGEKEADGKGNGETEDEGKGRRGAVEKGKWEGDAEVEDRGKSKAKNKTSHTKRPSNFIPGHSNVQKVPAGATAQKQPTEDTATNKDTCQQQFGGNLLPSPIPESDQSKDSEKNTSHPNAGAPPAAPDKGSATDQPASEHDSRRVSHTEVGEPPTVVDSQDMVTIEDEVGTEGQPLPLLMVHMEPHDYHCPTPCYPRGYRLHLPVQESEEGRSQPSERVPPQAQ